MRSAICCSAAASPPMPHVASQCAAPRWLTRLTAMRPYSAGRRWSAPPTPAQPGSRWTRSRSTSRFLRRMRSSVCRPSSSTRPPASPGTTWPGGPQLLVCLARLRAHTPRLGGRRLSLGLHDPPAGHHLYPASRTRPTNLGTATLACLKPATPAGPWTAGTSPGSQPRDRSILSWPSAQRRHSPGIPAVRMKRAHSPARDQERLAVTAGTVSGRELRIGVLARAARSRVAGGGRDRLRVGPASLVRAVRGGSRPSPRRLRSDRGPARACRS